MAAPPSRIKIGCAGWSIDKSNQPLFVAGDSLLERYASRFNAVEINSSFYRPHQLKTYQRWAQTVPASFRFSVKMPREITHDRKLIGAQPALARFLGEIAGLGRRLGAILVQLPPQLRFDPKIATAFFKNLRRQYAGSLICEPRNAGWFDASANSLFADLNISRAAVDPAKIPGSALPAGDHKTIYYRLHGSPRIYYSSYSDDYLSALAKKVRSVAAKSTVWIIFDNTALGHATVNALQLKRILS